MSNIPSIKIENFAWSFREIKTVSEVDFLIIANEYMKDIFGYLKWKPNEIIYNLTKIKIFIQGQPLTIFQIETLNPSGFTALEFITKLHNQLQNFDLGDHIYFESLEYVEDSDEKIEIYELYLGN